MIHIFFVPGMFGSSIEYVLQSFTVERNPVDAKIQVDGSMHSFTKQAHLHQLLDSDTMRSFFSSATKDTITTFIYPFQTHKLSELLIDLDSYISDQDQFILIHAGNLRDAELNLLFQYHKIVAGSNLSLGMDFFCGDNSHNIVNWNSNYSHWSEMQLWELREWFSLFYVEWVQEWIESQFCVEPKFLTVKNTDFLFDPMLTSSRIFDHCNLTQKLVLADFLQQWQQAQEYIVDEFRLLDQIVECSIANRALKWKPINVIAEAIVQQRLRALGYEIKCNNLNIFPIDSKTLYNLLEKV